MTQSQPKTKIWPQLMMVCATLIWGTSFLIMKQAVDDLPVFYLLAVRFSLGAGLLAVIFWKKWKSLDRATLKGGIVLGILMELAYIFQTYGLSGLWGLRGTTSGKNAFFTGIYCVLVPFLSWLLFKKRPDLYNVAAAFLCIAGSALVTLGGVTKWAGGDTLTILGGVMFALHILAVPRYAEKSDVILLTILQFATMAVLSWIGMVLTGQPMVAIPLDTWLRIGYLAVFATALALLFQNIGQAHTPPAAAAVLLSLEAPFGVLFAVLFGGKNEQLTPAMCAGFALIFFAIILSETKLSFLRRRKNFEKRG